MVGEKLWIKVLRALLKVIVLFVFVSPFYIALCYAVKSRKELAAGRLNFPQTIHWENFAEGIRRSNFFLALKNSAVTTVITVVTLLIICSMAAYIIARRKSRFYKAMYFVMLGATLIPFQAIISPLYSELRGIFPRFFLKTPRKALRHGKTEEEKNFLQSLRKQFMALHRLENLIGQRSKFLKMCPLPAAARIIIKR